MGSVSVYDEKDDIFCQVRAPGCTARAVHQHHRRMRSRGGTNDPVNLVATCWHCHQHIHLNPKDAQERGFLLHSWDEETPLERFW